MSIAPPPLCEHAVEALVQRSFRAECPSCGSFWDLDSLRQTVTYDASYPEQRGHFDTRVGALKVRTLERWLTRADIALASRVVCEVGFGGGACLQFLAERAGRVIGLEASEATLAHARDAGISADLFHVAALPRRLDVPVDLWIFQDSFEHIPDPAAFMRWVTDVSADRAEILLVAPRADSLSRRLMGRWWPHKLPDHQFHWSRAGLAAFMDRRRFSVRRSFFPLKYASPEMVLAHFRHKAGRPAPARRGASLAIPINFGEMGLVFQRRSQ